MTSGILIRTMCVEVSIASTRSSMLCSFDKEFWMRVICFRTCSTTSRSHTIRVSFQFKHGNKSSKLSLMKYVFGTDYPGWGIREAPSSSWALAVFLMMHLRSKFCLKEGIILYFSIGSGLTAQKCLLVRKRSSVLGAKQKIPDFAKRCNLF